LSVLYIKNRKISENLSVRKNWDDEKAYIHKSRIVVGFSLGVIIGYLKLGVLEFIYSFLICLSILIIFRYIKIDRILINLDKQKD
jgi:hypothetical protein